MTGFFRGLRSAGAALVMFAAILPGGSALALEAANPSAKRIVAIGGTITEILYALGAEDRIVARDSTSYYPDAATEKPDVGYMRQLSAEGVLAQQPDLILLEEGSGPPQVLDILRASDIAVVTVPTAPTSEGVAARIRDVGAAVGLSEKAEALAVETERKLEALAAEIAALKAPRKKVLFVLSFTNGRVLTGGGDTEAGAIIGLAGGINAGADVSGYKPLSDEAVIAAQPEVVLGVARGDHGLTPERAFAIPALQATPAAAEKALVTLDPLYLIGFGPRTPDAARELAARLYPDDIR